MLGDLLQLDPFGNEQVVAEMALSKMRTDYRFPSAIIGVIDLPGVASAPAPCTKGAVGLPVRALPVAGPRRWWCSWQRAKAQPNARL
jgi:hypothetical protein